MEFGRIDGIEKGVSRIVQGCMMLRDGEGQADANALLDAAWAAGINTFDHGYVYGGGACERAFGAWMAARGLRDEVVILDKGCHPADGRKRVSPELIEADVAESLRRLGTDRIDLWLFHRDDPDQPVGPLVETLNRLHGKARIGAFGGSNWTTQRIAEANEYAEKHGLIPFVASSPNFSLAEQVDSPWGPDCVTISGAANSEARAWYARSKVSVFAWSSLARGFLSGRISRSNFERTRAQLEEHTIRCYVTEDNWRRLEHAEQIARERECTVAQVALAYVLNQPFRTFALVGARSREEIGANIAALDIRLSAEEIGRLDLQT